MAIIKRLVGFVLAVALAGVLANPAKASSISITNASSTGNLDYLLSGNTSEPVKANLKIATEFFSMTQIILKFTVKNLTAASIKPFIWSLGFDVAPDSFITLSKAGTVFENIAINAVFPEYKRIDVCVFGDGRGMDVCAGGSAKDGLAAGQEDSFWLRFIGDYTQGLVLTQLPVKFQTNEGSFSVAPTPTSLSEPSTMALMLTGLALMAGFLLRRREERTVRTLGTAVPTPA